MRPLSFAVGALLVSCTAFCQVTLPTLVKTPGAKPAEFIGYPLKATDGVRVDAEGKEQPVPEKSGDAQTFEDTGGEQSVGLGPGVSLRWHLKELPGDKFYLYFLCRTGHQKGYEYVSPEMTYVVDLNGEEVEMELVAEVAAVRTYQSEQGWGHDMSWIRSTGMRPLAPGDALTVGCVEKYAFVTRCLLVNEDADALNRLAGHATRGRDSVGGLDALIGKIAEVFRTDGVQGACAASRRLLEGMRSEVDALQEDIAAAVERIEAGETVNLAPIRERAARIDKSFEDSEPRISVELREPLGAVLADLQERLAALPGATATTSYHRRQARYFAGVAGTYLDAAAGGLETASDLAALRRGVTRLWRAQQFVGEAEAEQELVGEERPLAPRAPARVEATQRAEVLLNGEWEMTTRGSPEAPGDGDWFKIRVPHGPWHETVGNFMALDRKWPGGQHWAWYRTRFTIPGDWETGRIKVHFEAVFHLCEVYLNGQFCGRHLGGFDAFDVDVTGAARPGESNEMLCFVHDTSITALDKSELEGQPTGCSSGPNHYIISDLWGARFGGIWQDVSLQNVPAVRVSDAFVITSVRQKQATVQTWLTNETDERLQLSLAQEVLDAGEAVLTLPGQEVVLEPRGTTAVEVSAPWETPKLWGIGGDWGNPSNLYYLRSSLSADAAQQPYDVHYQRFGFREFWIQGGQFYLNGERLPLQGGGGWYLQEGKIAHGNRWFGLHMYRSDRGMNVNILRWHRHGDVAREFLDLGDELGMLSELEGPYWGVYGIPDIMGVADWDDEVWVRNITDHYHRWARKHRNHPSLVLWSVENETFCSTQRPTAMLDRFLSFGQAINEEDPTRPFTLHGVENGGYCTKRDDIEIVNLHYPPNQRLEGWKEKWGGRPCINGEFQNYPVLFAMSSPDPAKSAEAVDSMCEYIRSWTSYYEEIELSGALNFLPYICGLFTTADRSLMGPWADLLGDPTTAPVTKEGWRKGSVSLGAMVPIPWPSLSGPGIKCEALRTGSGHRSLINWFDPSRPSITPNKAYQAFADYWGKMPKLPARRAPEVIVHVTRDGEPVVGLPVIARPLAAGLAAPRGAMTDPNGTAWLVFKEAGEYEIRCGDARVRHKADLLDTYARPGYGDIPRMAVEL